MASIDWVSQNGDTNSEAAIVLEIWNRGAIFNTSVQIFPSTEIKICIHNKIFMGSVVSCSRDLDFGYIVEIAVDVPGQWFPEFVPAWTLPAQTCAAMGGYVC